MFNELTPGLILTIVVLYFIVLMIVSWFTGRDSGNENFFVAGRKSPWYLVAFGMIGASLSGVTFISIPGVVGAGGANMAFSYMQMVFGYLLGYFVIATVLLPLYYRMQLTSIYSYLEDRFGFFSYKTGAFYFLLSRTIGASFRLFLVAMVFQLIFDRIEGLNIPFWLTVLITIILIWTYTYRGGIKTIVWTDTLQTLCMLTAVILTIFAIGNALGADGPGGIVSTIQNSDYSRMFFFDGGWSDPNNFFKQFLAGASIAIVMTGLDQDMMQKNLTCRSLGDAQKNMFWFSIVLVFANLLFLAMGALLYIYANAEGIPIPEKTDQLYPIIALEHLSPVIGIVFILGLIAAAYSSADSALTSLTTSFCVDFLDFEKKEKVHTEEIKIKESNILDDIKEGKTKRSSSFEADQKQTRFLVHIGFSFLLFLVIIAFWYINDQSVINQLFKIAGYTYGPLLGLYAFGLFTKMKIQDSLAPLVCLAAPVICYILNAYSETLFFGYKFGFELLILNGLITFIGLLIISKRE